jgi:hypothetical protein
LKAVQKTSNLGFDGLVGPENESQNPLRTDQTTCALKNLTPQGIELFEDPQRGPLRRGPTLRRADLHLQFPVPEVQTQQRTNGRSPWKLIGGAVTFTRMVAFLDL